MACAAKQRDAADANQAAFQRSGAPQYRLRVGDVRVFYDVNENRGDRAQVGDHIMATKTRKVRGRVKVKEVPLAAVKDDLSRYLREAERGEIVITRHGKPAGVLIGFKSEEDWFDYRLEKRPPLPRSGYEGT